MLILIREKSGFYKLTSKFTDRNNQDLLEGMTLAEAVLVVRYKNGGSLTGGEKNTVDDLIANNEVPLGAE